MLAQQQALSRQLDRRGLIRRCLTAENPKLIAPLADKDAARPAIGESPGAIGVGQKNKAALAQNETPISLQKSSKK
jgi:hypothetical protein